jgi:hypothetical protein
MRYVITHGHIFKNAGTTFDYALEKAFGKDFCDHRDDKAMRRGGAEYLKQFILDNPKLKAISSHHLCNPLPESNQFKCIPIYFVRNPIERIVSVYDFERKQKTGTIGAKMAAKLSLVDYVKWRSTSSVAKVIFDYQTAYIGRRRYLRPSETANLEMFNNAVKRICDDHTLVGTVDKFEESFEYISEELKKHFPNIKFDYMKKNVNNQKSTDQKLLDALERLRPILANVINGNAYDLALHRVASQKLSRLIPKADYNSLS